MNIDKYKKDCYVIAKEKGFYSDNSKIEEHITGILSELFEAYEAHRAGSFTDKVIYTKNWIKNPNHISLVWRQLYIKKVKDTFEDEITDLFIRVFNLSSYLNVSTDKIKPLTKNLENKTLDQQIIILDQLILQFNDITPRLWFKLVLNTLYGFCNIYRIDLKLHLPAKIQFNKSRSYLHGKNY